MSDIIITYRPVRFIPFRLRLKRDFPDSFSVLSRKQFITIASFFEKKKPLLRDQILLIRVMLNIRNRLFFRLEDYQVHELLKQLEWMQHVAFNKVFIKSFKAGIRTLRGPKDGFQNMSFDEFAHVDTYFARYAKTKDPEDLHKMTASFYRPADYMAGKLISGRADFDEQRVDYHADIVRKADPQIISAILFNYKVLRRWIENLYPMIFPAALPDENPDSGKNTKESPGWSKVRRMMTGGDLASVETIGRLPVHTVLAEMNDRIKEIRKRQ